MHTQLTLSPKGLMLAGNLLAKRTTDGALAIGGQEARIQALLIAAYGKPVSLRTMDSIKRAGALLAQVQDGDWDSRTPHRVDDVPALAKAQMMLALAGLGSMGEENIPILAETLRKLDKGIPAYALLKEYLRKDDDGDEDDDSDDDDSEDDDSNEGEDEDGDESDFNAKHPRWPAGSPDGIGGEFAPKDNAAAATTAGTAIAGDNSPTTDDVRNSPESAVTQITSYTPAAYTTTEAGPSSTPTVVSSFTDNNGNTIVQYSDGTTKTLLGGFSEEADLNAKPVTIASNPATVSLNDGSTIPNPYTGGSLLMPSEVSLQANATLGEWMATLPTIPTSTDDVTREEMMVNYFERDGAMDYQRQDGVFTSAYRDFGNYNYGVVAAAAGYTLNQALDAAAAENLTGSGDKSGTPFGSNPRNNYFITAGYNAYIGGKIK